MERPQTARLALLLMEHKQEPQLGTRGQAIAIPQRCPHPQDLGVTGPWHLLVDIVDETAHLTLPLLWRQPRVHCQVLHHIEVITHFVSQAFKQNGIGMRLNK